MIYFIQVGRTGPIKIGFSKNIKKRLQTLQTANPYTLYVIGYMPGDKKVEKAIHRKFSYINIFREWFFYDANLMQYIKQNTKPFTIKKTNKSKINELREQCLNYENDIIFLLRENDFLKKMVEKLLNK